MRTILTCMCALGLSVIGAAAQTSQSQSGQQQQQQRQQTAPSQPLQNVVTFTGCVYQPSDDPTLYAIRRMDMEKGTSSGSSSSTSSQRTSPGTSQSSQSNSSDRTDGARTSSSSGAASGHGRTEGAWYRLTSGAAQDLKPYVGQRVRVNGQLTPGRDTQGNDIVIHQITPEKTVVTAIDLKPAPQLSIASITPLGGSCNATATASQH